MYESLTREGIGFFIVFRNGNIEIADYALVFLKLHVCPLAVVQKLLHILLQTLEHAFVCALNLRMVDGYLSLQFLCRTTEWQQAHQ